MKFTISIFTRKEDDYRRHFIPDKNPVRIVLTSGASCPDTIVDRVLLKVLAFFETPKTVEKLLRRV